MIFRPLICILAHQDPPRLRRAIESVHRAIHVWDGPADYAVVINTQDEAFKDTMVTELQAVPDLNVVLHVSESNGTAGQGKQSCFNYFGGYPEHSHLFLLDGDDYLYPWGLQSLASCLEASDTPIDVLTFHQHDSRTFEGALALVDPVGPASASHFLTQPGAPWLFDTEEIWGPGKTLLFSHKATTLLKWDTDTRHLWEDTLLLMHSLKHHLDGHLQSVLTMDPDVFFYDRHPEMHSAQADPARIRTNLCERVLATGLTEETAHVGQLPVIEIDETESSRARINAHKRLYIDRFDPLDRYTAPLTDDTLTHALHEWTAMTAPAPPQPEQPIRRTDVPTQFIYVRQMMRAEPARALVELAETKGFGQATFVDGSPRGNTASYFAQWDQVQDEPALIALFERMRRTAELAAPFWGIELYPELLTQIQFSRYQPGDHYGVHVDHDSSLLNLEYDRKLSLYMALSEGTFEIEGQVLHFGPGDGAAFPAWMAHAAPEQTEGTRYSVVAWVPGPPWR